MKNAVIFRLLAAFGIMLFLLPGKLTAQSVERGFVKEYHGEQAKTPLAGVELNIVGAPSTVSDEEGKYVLKFAKLKPGQNVNFNEIYKQGYVIFNKTQLDSWRISNNQTPFTIVMCKESSFRETKRYYDGIIRKAYDEELAKQKALVKKMASNIEDLKTSMKQLEEEYEEKISNINTYVELFARIDRSETDSIRARALQLMENGKIDEAIRTYDQIDLTSKAEEQIRKLNAGQTAMNAARNMIDNSHQDLLTLIETAKEKIGVYQMGGSKYNSERNYLISQLIDWYTVLNEAMSGRYNEELGQWTCTYAEYTKAWMNRLADYRLAANLPSWHGLYRLAQHQYVLAYQDVLCVDTARYCLQKALTMELPDSMRNVIQHSLNQLPDFYATLSNGDTICYKQIAQDSAVAAWPRTPFCANRVKGEIVLPATVANNGKRYLLTAIADKAFYRNQSLHKMTLPDGVRTIGNIAFGGSALDTLIIGKGMLTIDKYALPSTTTLIVPQKLSKSDWYIRHEHRRDSLKSISKDTTQQKSYDHLIADARNASGDVLKSAKQALLKHYVQVVQEEAKNEQRRLPEGFPAIEYEEMVSIGILTMRELIKGKTFDQLAELNDKRLSTAVKWCIRNYLRRRYDWYDYIASQWGNKEKEEQRTYTGRMLWLKEKVKVVQQMSRSLYDLQTNPQFKMDYEEMVSIGIIAVQAMIKDKDESLLEKYTDDYIATAVKWAIINESSYRYDWFKELYLKDWTLLGGQTIHADIDTRRLVGYVILCRELNNSYQRMNKMQPDSLTPHMQELRQKVFKQWDTAQKLVKKTKIQKDFLEAAMVGSTKDEDVLVFVKEAQSKYRLSVKQMNVLLCELFFKEEMKSK